MDKEAEGSGMLYSLMSCLRVCKLLKGNNRTYITVTIGSGNNMQKAPNRIIILRGTLPFPSPQRALKLCQLHTNMKTTIAIFRSQKRIRFDND